jgi:hypothetical protein
MTDKPKPPTRKQCQDAACWECLGFYSDGKQDCENVRCPHYSYMPYRKLEPNLWWAEYATRRKGKVKKIDCRVILTDKQLESRRETLRQGREKLARRRQKGKTDDIE